MQERFWILLRRFLKRRNGAQPQYFLRLGDWGRCPNKPFRGLGTGLHCLPLVKTTYFYGKEIENMTNTYTSIDQLPITLCAEDVAQVLGISRAGAYTLMHSKGFPTIQIGKRMVVPKDKLLA